MKLLTNLLFILALSRAAYSQAIDSSFCVDGSFRIKGITMGITLINPCDTVFLLNKSTYRLYREIYNTANKRSANTQYINALTSANEIYEGRIKEQDVAYSLLLQKFDSLHFASQDLVKSSMKHTESIEKSIGEASESIERMKTSLETLEQSIREERRRSFMQKVLAFGGGIGVGVLVGVIVVN